MMQVLTQPANSHSRHHQRQARSSAVARWVSPCFVLPKRRIESPLWQRTHTLHGGSARMKHGGREGRRCFFCQHRDTCVPSTRDHSALEALSLHRGPVDWRNLDSMLRETSKHPSDMNPTVSKLITWVSIPRVKRQIVIISVLSSIHAVSGASR